MNKLLTEESFAENEPPVQPADFIEEIAPLIEEYFIGEVTFEGNLLRYCLPNGGIIKITAENSDC